MSTDETQKAVRGPAMTENKRPWTPGPWECWKGHANVYAGPSTFNSEGRLSGYRGEICSCDSGDFPENEQFANADLIAAAPAMHEALESCVKTLHYVNTMRVVETDSLRETLDQARAALRAANPDAFESEGE